MKQQGPQSRPLLFVEFVGWVERQSRETHRNILTDNRTALSKYVL